MSRPARVQLANDQPDGVIVATVAPEDRRLITGLDAGPNTDATHLADALWAVADKSQSPLVLDLRNVDWIDSGACAVLIRFWKELRGKGRTLVLCVTEPVRETFRITGLVRLISCFADMDDAAAAARTAQPALDAKSPTG